VARMNNAQQNYTILLQFTQFIEYLSLKVLKS